MGERGPFRDTILEFPVYGANLLTVQTPHQAIVPVRIQPSGKILLPLIKVGEASLCMQKEAIGPDGIGGTGFLTQRALIATLKGLQLPPVVLVAGEIGNKGRQAMKAAHALHVGDVVGAVSGQSAAYRQKLHGQNGSDHLVSFRL